MLSLYSILFESLDENYNAPRKGMKSRWSTKYKKSINCSNPRGFSQRAHCQARQKRKSGEKTKSKSPFKK